MSYGPAIDSKKLAEEREAFALEWEAYAQSIGHKTGGVSLTPDSWYECKRLPIRPGYLTQSQDGKQVAPVMGSLSQHDGGLLGITMYPMIWFVACSDHAMLFRCAPTTPTQTEVEMTWLVRDSSVEGVDYDVERVSWLWRVTMEQDVKIIENNQLGVNSRRYQPGPYSKIESPILSFIEWYLKQIA